MTWLKSWLETARTELRKFYTWFYVALLALLPYGDSIMAAVSVHMPALAEYLPANVYKALGVAIVVVNIIRSAHRTHKGEPK